jgi:CPA2 family monovalent cation:H+ antiporter-2
MTHLATLISDLGLILAAAGSITLLFKKIKQPIVLGYILAGILVGPYIDIFPTVLDKENITIWAEIGVIFLLFSLGLEFSFKKLVKVGGSSSFMAVTEAVVMIILGYLAGKAMGWSTMDCIFLGGILSVSSTTIIIRALDELGLKSQRFAGLVFGVLIVEDLIAILIMVLLSTLAVSQQFQGVEMLTSVLKLGFFLVLWFIGGIFLVPTFLKKTRNLMNDETMLIVSLALCLVMVSPALGAFIMGSILAETIHAEKIEHLVKSVTDLFGAVFFVSVGMMIDPQIIVQYATPVIIITIVTIVGKIISTGGGALLTGQPLKISVQAGMSVSQIGEFSFIIATLGMSLGVISDFLYPIAVAVSAITTFTTPYMIKYSENFFLILNRSLPKPWIKHLNRYSSSAENVSTTSDWKTLLRGYLSNTIIHTALTISIIFLLSRYLKPFIFAHILNKNLGLTIVITISLALLAPSIWALSIRKIKQEEYSQLWLRNFYNRGPLIALEALRLGIGAFLVGFLLEQFFPTAIVAVIAFVSLATIIVVFSGKLQLIYSRIEHRFISNLNEREIRQQRHSYHNIVPWDNHLADFELSSDSPWVGYTLKELEIREKYGVNIIMIERGQKTIPVPNRDERLFPHDTLSILGNDIQLAVVQPIIEKNNPLSVEADSPFDRESLKLQKFEVKPGSKLDGHTIASLDIRDRLKALIVGIERDGKRMLNPHSSVRLQSDDLVWIVGPKKLIDELFEEDENVHSKEI